MDIRVASSSMSTLFTSVAPLPHNSNSDSRYPLSTLSRILKILEDRHAHDAHQRPVRRREEGRKRTHWISRLGVTLIDEWFSTPRIRGYEFKFLCSVIWNKLALPCRLAMTLHARKKAQTRNQRSPYLASTFSLFASQFSYQRQRVAE